MKMFRIYCKNEIKQVNATVWINCRVYWCSCRWEL